MAESDWDTVTVLRKKPQKASALKTTQAVNAAQRQGLLFSSYLLGFVMRKIRCLLLCLFYELFNVVLGIPVETSKKYNAATNKHAGTTMNTAKLDRETEELHHNRVGLDVGKLIQQGRQAKSLTQKDLATKICEKPQVVNEYESGKAIPNQQVLAKIERVIGLKLRGKEKGQPMGGGGKK